LAAAEVHGLNPRVAILSMGSEGHRQGTPAAMQVLKTVPGLDLSRCMPFSYYEVDSWLHQRNPTAKLAAHLLLSLLMTVVFDPITPLVFLALALLIGTTVARLPLRVFLRALVPFWLLAFSLMLSNALFAARPDQATVLWSWGPFTATLEGATIEYRWPTQHPSPGSPCC
jgi:hypothetical protein